MSDFVLDSDPLIPTGTPADTGRVTVLIAEGVLPPDRVPLLVPEQQPEPADVEAATDEFLLRELGA